ncbi:Cysteine desulfurase [compost metagenome]
MRAEVVVHALEKKGIYISTRSACTSGESEPSEVMLAMGCSRDLAVSGLRVSFGDEHQATDIEQFLRALQEVVQELAPMRSQSVSQRGKRV